MSGTVGFGNNLTPVYSDAVASEGSKTCQVKINWAQTFAGGNAPGVVTINLLQQYQTNQFTAIQAVYVNNTTCPYQVTLLCQDTGFIITVPPFTQGMYPILSSSAPTFLATLVYAMDVSTGTVIFGCSTTFHFLNTPQGRYQFSLPKYGNNFVNVSEQITLVYPADANPAAAQFAYTTGIVALPRLAPNTFYLICQLEVSVTFLGSYTTNEPGALLISEYNTIGGIGNNPPNYLRIVHQIIGQTPQNSAIPNEGQLPAFVGNFSFDPPILFQVAQGGLLISSQLAPPTAGPFGSGQGGIVVAYTISAGTVLIQ